MRPSRIAAAALLPVAIPMASSSTPQGIKLIYRDTHDGIAFERTEYFQQDRKRTEHRSFSRGGRTWYGADATLYGPRIASIIRCDLGQSFELNLDGREFTISSYPPKFLTAKLEAPGMPSWDDFPKAYSASKPTFRIETTTVDTGERKEIFGRQARHVITTRKEIPFEGSTRSVQETVTDGWYIDLDINLSCAPKHPDGTRIYTLTAVYPMGSNRPVEKPEFIDHGEPETGFVIRAKRSFVSASAPGPAGEVARPSVTETDIELVEGPLDPSLFEVPPDFRRVRFIDTSPPRASASSLSSPWDRLWAAIARLFH